MTVTNDIDLDQLLADTEAEILRVVGDRDPSTAGVYEMIRYHLGLDGSDGPRGKRMRPAPGPPRLRVDRRRARARPARRRRRGAGPQLQPRPRRHRGRRRRAPPPGHAVGGPRRAAGDQHRRPDLQPQPRRAAPPRRTSASRDAQGPAPHAPLRRDLRRRCARASTSTSRRRRRDDADDGRALLRHDRPQDRGAHRRLDRGRRAAGDRRRGGHRRLPALRLGARASPSSSTTTCWASGAQEQKTGKVPTDVARHKKTLPVHLRVRARGAGGPRAPGRAVPPCRARPTTQIAEIVAILERVGRAGLHPRRGAALPRRVPGRARRAHGRGRARPASSSTAIIVAVISAT